MGNAEGSLGAEWTEEFVKDKTKEFLSTKKDDCRTIYDKQLKPLVKQYRAARAMVDVDERRKALKDFCSNIHAALCEVRKSCDPENKDEILKSFVEDIRSHIWEGCPPKRHCHRWDHKSLTREHLSGVTGVVLYDHNNNASEAAMEIIYNVLVHTPKMRPLTLEAQATKTRPLLREFFIELGREREEGDLTLAEQMMSEFFATEDGDPEKMLRAQQIQDTKFRLVLRNKTGEQYHLTDSIPNFAKQRFTIDGRFVITGAELKALAEEARIVYGRRVNNGTVGLDEAPTMYAPLKDYHDFADKKNRMYYNEEENKVSQMVAVSGPVYIIFDNEQSTDERVYVQGNCMQKVHCVSIPAMNFSIIDNPDHKGMIDDTGYVYGKGKTRIYTFKSDPEVQTGVLKRMRAAWFLALEAFRLAGVRFPVLSAIGCGVYRRNVFGVVERWAHSLCQVLVRAAGLGFGAIFICLPAAGGNVDYNNDNYTHFKNAMDKWQTHISVPVILLQNHSALTVADYLSRHLLLPTGLLNPSDNMVTRCGVAGMQWEGGSIALEEFIANNTTLLVQHGDVNPDLYNNNKRPFTGIEMLTDVVEDHNTRQEPVFEITNFETAFHGAVARS